MLEDACGAEFVVSSIISSIWSGARDSEVGLGVDSWFDDNLVRVVGGGTKTSF